MALNAFGNVPYAVGGFGGARLGRLGMPPRPLGLRARSRRGVGDLVEWQVRRNAQREIPGGRNFLGDLVEFQQLPSRGRTPRFTPPAGFSGGRFGGPRRGLRLRGLGADEPQYDPSEFADFEGAKWRKGKGPKAASKKKGKKPGRAVKCKMVKISATCKRRMCWDAKGMITKTPKRKKRKK